MNIIETMLRDWWLRVFPAPVPARRRYPRTTCANCGRDVAHTSRGTYRHSCQPATLTTTAGGVCGVQGADAGLGTGPAPSAPDREV